MAAQPTTLTLCKIHSPDDQHLPAVLALSNTVFSVADVGSTKHSSLAHWQSLLAHPSSSLIYLAPSSAIHQPCAFVFVKPRTADPPLQNGATESLHIWLAGVHPDYRRCGCFGRMVDELDRTLQLTVCTYPERFPNMWAWLRNRGWIEERTYDDGKLLFSRSPA